MMMKKLFLKIALMSVLIFLSNVVLNQVIYPRLALAPWTYGSELLHKKLSQFDAKEKPFNTLFIGSSRVYRQISPLHVDSVAGTRSFNLGVNWLFVPETFYVLENLIHASPAGSFESETPSQMMVLELSKVRSVDYRNLHTTRTIYWYTWPLYRFAVYAVWHSGYPVIGKLGLITIHTISYIDYLLNLGYLTSVISFHSLPENDISQTNHGYEPLDDTQGSFGMATELENAGGRRQKFLNDTTVVTKRKMESIKAFSEIREKKSIHLNEYYLAYLSDLIDSAKKQNIHLIFLLSPRMDKAQYRELIPVFEKLPEASRIELADGNRFPELYTAGWSYDETHLNAEGAAHYSKLLGQELLRCRQMVENQGSAPR
jgi:hypothetical protein